ncbi:MAG: hypothetical protein H6631_17475 [Anaerolineaceae bacterium]|nr:hypothetical protein [Anaerolineaceae bacterium]
MKSSKRFASKVTLYILLLLFSTGGCFLGYQLGQYGLEDNDTWQDLGAPPETIERLAAVHTVTVYVETSEGKIFSCYRESLYDYNCWNEIEAIPPGLDLGVCPQPVYGMPSEPGDVVDRLIAHHCLDAPLYKGDHVFAYLLLADGRVMQWVSEPMGLWPPLGQLGQLVLKTFGGCLAGMIIALFFWRLP